LVSGFTATPCGVLPTPTVATTVFVRPLITTTAFSFALLT
jgi:hypothetical protein